MEQSCFYLHVFMYFRISRDPSNGRLLRFRHNVFRVVSSGGVYRYAGIMKVIKMKTKTGYTNFDGLCALLVALSIMNFVASAFIKRSIDYFSLGGIVFGMVMPKVVKRWFLK